jgi:hypothetical protein
MVVVLLFIWPFNVAYAIVWFSNLLVLGHLGLRMLLICADVFASCCASLWQRNELAYRKFRQLYSVGSAVVLAHQEV